jgi:hypothetical protein
MADGIGFSSARECPEAADFVEELCSCCRYFCMIQ